MIRIRVFKNRPVEDHFNLDDSWWENYFQSSNKETGLMCRGVLKT